MKLINNMIYIIDKVQATRLYLVKVIKGKILY